MSIPEIGIMPDDMQAQIDNYPMPEGYEVVSVASYPTGMSPFGTELGYKFAAQLMRVQVMKDDDFITALSDPTAMPRGTGETLDEAIRAALAQVQPN